jgi:hypothetical protein
MYGDGWRLYRGWMVDGELEGLKRAVTERR